MGRWLGVGIPGTGRRPCRHSISPGHTQSTSASSTVIRSERLRASSRATSTGWRARSRMIRSLSRRPAPSGPTSISAGSSVASDPFRRAERGRSPHARRGRRSMGGARWRRNAVAMIPAGVSETLSSRPNASLGYSARDLRSGSVGLDPSVQPGVRSMIRGRRLESCPWSSRFGVPRPYDLERGRRNGHLVPGLAARRSMARAHQIRDLRTVAPVRFRTAPAKWR